MLSALHLYFGIWLGMLSLPGATLPFNFDLKKENGKTVFIIHNAEERIYCDDVIQQGDSLFIQLPVFNSEIRVRVSEQTMSGKWINHGRKGNPEIDFFAQYNIDYRFRTTEKPKHNISGRWETWFDAGTPDSALAIGVFTQKGEKVSGTFLTETGDHRYLEGVVDGDSLKLSVFDGSHCWLYMARIRNNEMTGVQWSGTTYKGNWRSVKNEIIKLKDPETITTIDGKLSFSFPDTDSNMVSLNDARFRGKAVIIQIMGSWCPNCMDESAFLAANYKRYHDEGLEIIGLSFERFPEFARAATNVKRFTSRLKIDYPVLIAGVTGKDEVMKKLPGLKNFTTFPTTIYIDRSGQVVKIHAGFSGPATGADYDEFVKNFAVSLKQLMR